MEDDTVTDVFYIDFDLDKLITKGEIWFQTSIDLPPYNDYVLKGFWHYHDVAKQFLSDDMVPTNIYFRPVIPHINVYKETGRFCTKQAYFKGMTLID